MLGVKIKFFSPELENLNNTGMQFQIPQFIETEDKVLGPLTLKQFGYIGGATIVVFLLFYVLNFFLWLLIAVLFGGIAGSLAFVRVNGRPLMIYASTFLSTIWSPKVYVFKPTMPTRKLGENITVPADSNVVLAPKKVSSVDDKATGSRTFTFGGIKGLRSWIETSKNAIPRREKPLPRDFGTPREEISEKFEVVRHLTGEREVAKRVDYR